MRTQSQLYESQPQDSQPQDSPPQASQRTRFDRITKSLRFAALAAGLAWVAWGVPAATFGQSQGGPSAPAGGPHLEWRSLEGTVARMELTQSDLAQASNFPGVWMKPIGFSPFPRLEGEEVAEVGLIGGDHVRARALGGDEEALALEGSGGRKLRVSIDRLESLQFPERHQDLIALERPPQGDRLYRRTGQAIDRVDGVLLGFSEQGIAMESALGERVFAWGEVVALFIEPLGDGLDGPGEDSEQVVVHLTCGSRLRGALQGLESDELVLAASVGEWRIPYAWLHEMMRLDGSFQVLSWLPRAAQEEVRSPFDPPGAEPLGMVWEPQVDRTVHRELLRAGGRQWSLGLGVHAPSRLRWELDGTDCFLRFSAGLDESARRGEAMGSVEFQVWLDGEPVWSSGVRQGDQAPVTPDPISLRGAKTLELVVTDGGDGPVLDRAAWLEPLLIRCP